MATCTSLFRTVKGSTIAKKRGRLKEQTDVSSCSRIILLIRSSRPLHRGITRSPHNQFIHSSLQVHSSNALQNPFSNIRPPSTRLSSRLDIMSIELTSPHLVLSFLRDSSVFLTGSSVSTESVDEAVHVASDGFSCAVELSPCVCYGQSQGCERE